jgi:aldehyde:ferredoxin oxidoreductase
MTEFYGTVGWDLSNGCPTKEKMIELEIDGLFTG